MQKTIENVKRLEDELEDLKRQMDIETDRYTLAQYEILKRAWKINLKINPRYSKMQLAEYFEISYSRVKRLLSLDRMTNRTKELVKQRKISLFLVATITSSRNRHFQEEIVDKAIKYNYTTHDLKRMKISELSDLENIKDNRMMEVEQNGYTRKYSAYLGFQRALNNMNLFLTMPFSNFPQEKHKELRNRLKLLKNML